LWKGTVVDKYGEEKLGGEQIERADQVGSKMPRESYKGKKARHGVKI